MLLRFHILGALLLLASQDPEMNFTHFKFTHSLKLLWGKFATLFLIPNSNFEKSKNMTIIFLAAINGL